MATVVGPPVLDRSLQQALLGFAQPLGQGLAAGAQNRALQQFALQQGLNVPQGLSPQIIAALIAKQFDPFGQQAAQADLTGAQTGLAQRQTEQIGQPAPSAFAEKQAQIDRLAAIPKDQRTPTQQAQLNQLLGQKPKAGTLQVAKTDDGTGLPVGTVFQADQQGNIKIISEPGGVGLSAVEKTKLAVTQAKEFRADPRIKNLQIIERSERGMQAALKMATSPNVKSRIASDQTLGVLFQKMLDPESVVRESEFARTPEGAAAINRILAITPQLRLGGLRLLDEDRRALVAMARKLLTEAKVTANRAFDEFETRANEIGLNKKIIFGGRKRFDIQIQQPQNQQFTPDQVDAELRRRGAIP